MRTKAISENGVLKPFEKLDLPEKIKVRVTIKGSFSKLLEDVGEREAQEDIDRVLEDMKARDYYG
jgi:predicted DNA-binding antitoxin AbrB/MazE fold protein